MPFTTHQAALDPSFPHHWWYYIRSCNLAELTDEVIDALVDHGLRIASPLTVFSIYHLGGAVARVGEDETAFGGRDAGHTVNVIGTTTTGEGFDEEREWARGLWTALRPHQHVYVSFLMEEGSDPGGLRRGQVRAPEGAQAQVRPEQLLPAQPEHPAARIAIVRDTSGTALARRPSEESR